MKFIQLGDVCLRAHAQNILHTRALRRYDGKAWFKSNYSNKISSAPHKTFCVFRFRI
ncbi:hypothetical protein [uncultured Campylobacter sp.]|uniref:hypothetical protein n=1 Tax=uncultured Campylobacter sp. TaxID=218934 RepID=UPI0026258FCE|nr:hypothetical protein [uncultured Campylobacter sp.]